MYIYIQHPEGSMRSPHAGTQHVQAWCRSQKWPLGHLNDLDMYDGPKEGNIMGYFVVNCNQYNIIIENYHA